MAREIYCPYCNRLFDNKYAVYGHWRSCESYKEFLQTHERDERLPLRWTGKKRGQYVPAFGPGLLPDV